MPDGLPSKKKKKDKRRPHISLFWNGRVWYARGRDYQICLLRSTFHWKDRREEEVVAHHHLSKHPRIVKVVQAP